MKRKVNDEPVKVSNDLYDSDDDESDTYEKSKN